MIYGLARNLPKSKYEITILHPSRSKQTIRKWEEEIEVIYFPSFFLPNVNYTLPLIPEALKILSNLIDYDIIQVGDYFYPTSIPPLLSSRDKSKPTVLTINALPGYSWKYGSKIIDFAARMYTYSIGQKILDGYDKIITIYNKLREDLQRFGVPAKKICNIYNGVDVERFQKIDFFFKDRVKKRLSIRDDEKVILFVGRLSKVKNIGFVIALAQKLRAEGQRIKTIIVGEGVYRSHYEHMTRKNDGVIFTGWVSSDYLPVLYSIANVVVLPSSSEGLPNVLLEASASGKPVVASNVNGVPEIVIHNKTGLLVKQDDFNSFYQSTKFILDDLDMQEKFGRNARSHIKNTFNWQNIVTKYDILYDELLSSS